MPQTYHSRLSLKSLQNILFNEKSLESIYVQIFGKKLADCDLNLLSLKTYLSAEDMGSVGVPREKIASGGAYKVLQKLLYGGYII